MENQQHPKWNIQQMRPVENFKATASSHKRLRTQKHYDEYEKERDAGWIRTATA